MFKFLLLTHLSLVSIVAVVFIARLITLLRKNTDQQIRKLFHYSSASLVVSGAMLSGFSRLPITKICLESLGLIIALTIADFAVAFFSRRIELRVTVKK